ncbi:MAG: Uma2 family endonuclease [Byssovorax sp.]
MVKFSDHLAKYDGPGPFRASDLRSGDRYELSNGHAIYCAPTGGDGSRATVTGAQVLNSDPVVTEAGIDAGYSQKPGDLRAPDIAVGNVPDRPGWIAGVPPLAVEYASVGQDEAKLQEKIADLLSAGTRWVWVVRLLAPRRVEVHEKEQPVRTFNPGEELLAPGVLRNPVLVEALYDQAASNRATLRNLLQREGYESLAQVRGEGRGEGRDEGLLEGRALSLLQLLGKRHGEVPRAVRERILACRDLAVLDAWFLRALDAKNLADVMG